MNKLRTTIALTLICLLSQGQSCNKSDLTTAADDIVFSFTRAKPFLVVALPNSAAKIDLAISLADRLKAAVAANNSTDAVGLLNQIIPIFNEIVEKDIVNLDPHTRTQIMAALAVADIGLHLLVRRFLSSASSSQARSASAGVLRDFDRKQSWGHLYKRK